MTDLTRRHLYVTVRNEDGLTHAVRFQNRAALNAHLAATPRLTVARIETIEPRAKFADDATEELTTALAAVEGTKSYRDGVHYAMAQAHELRTELKRRGAAV